MTTDNLAQKAALLKTSEHFDNHSTDNALAEKQNIFLVLCGKKPVAEATSGKWVKTVGGAHSEPEDYKILATLLTDLGLAFQLHSDAYATNAVISLNPLLVTQYTEAHDAVSVGRLFGYPDTAVEAFIHNELMSTDEQDRLMEAAGLPPTMPGFRFSLAHAAQEITVLRDWYDALQMYNLM